MTDAATKVLSPVSLKVAINAQLLPSAGSGGIQTVLIGLVHALGQLDGPEHYSLIGPWEEPDWLKPYTGRNQTIVRGPRTEAVKKNLAPFKPLIRMALKATSWVPGIGGWPRVPKSTGFYEGLGCQVIHFPYQQFVISTLPSVFNPHDLQHVHYPQFFSAAEVKWKETVYGVACREAQTIAVSSEWVRRDVSNHYKVPINKIQVIAWPPPTHAYESTTPEILERVRREYKLDQHFALYPAMTWEHKNHVRLLQALALLRERSGKAVHLVCTGHQTEHFSRIKSAVADLRLENEVKFLGMVPAAHIRALYRLAQFMIFPSLFEAAGGPLVEAWGEGTPVACAAVTSLPEQAGNAALLFDPLSVDEMATALEKMAGDAAFREVLVRRGAERLKAYSWERTAKAYRAVYRRAAGCPVNDEDRWLLEGSRA